MDVVLLVTGKGKSGKKRRSRDDKGGDHFLCKEEGHFGKKMRNGSAGSSSLQTRPASTTSQHRRHAGERGKESPMPKRDLEWHVSQRTFFSRLQTVLELTIDAAAEVKTTAVSEKGVGVHDREDGELWR